MSTYCCGALGMSSHAIARVFGYCCAGGRDYPHDPSDLRRCRDYCAPRGITQEMIAERMPAVSPQWAALAPAWAELLDLLAEGERLGSGRATYTRMCELLDNASPALPETGE